MRYRDLAQALDHLAESSHILDQMLKMPPHRVDLLLQLLSNPASVAAMRRLLSTVRHMQLQDPRARVSGGRALQRKADGSKSSAPTSRGALTTDLEPLLRDVFKDQSRFPTVAAIAKFVHDVFRIEVPHQKLGRDRYIGRVVTALNKSPRALHSARAALADSEPSQRDEAYTALYNFIRGRLSE